MKDIELHLFTNAVHFSPDVEMIETTFKSFIDTFKCSITTHVWFDPKPKKEAADQYHLNLEKIFDNVTRTTGLADGFVKAITTSKSEFMFILEHDWKFYSEHIHHSLEEICSVMRQDNLLQMRFNKRKTELKGWDHTLDEKKRDNIKYCITPSVSNNPHILNTKKYVNEAIQYIKIPKNGTSVGIEEVLSAEIQHLYGSIYGPLNHPATVYHTDGGRSPQRKLWKK
tara:strand:+ start:2418 stop:3095 length:678 start_codon:yes stop_codon:yes gene_type:complete